MSRDPLYVDVLASVAQILQLFPDVDKTFSSGSLGASLEAVDHRCRVSVQMDLFVVNEFGIMDHPVKSGTNGDLLSSVARSKFAGWCNDLVHTYLIACNNHTAASIEAATEPSVQNST